MEEPQIAPEHHPDRNPCRLKHILLALLRYRPLPTTTPPRSNIKPQCIQSSYPAREWSNFGTTAISNIFFPYCNKLFLPPPQWCKQHFLLKRSRTKLNKKGHKAKLQHSYRWKPSRGGGHQGETGSSATTATPSAMCFLAVSLLIPMNIFD